MLQLRTGVYGLSDLADFMPHPLQDLNRPIKRQQFWLVMQLLVLKEAIEQLLHHRIDECKAFVGIQLATRGHEHSLQIAGHESEGASCFCIAGVFFPNQDL